MPTVTLLTKDGNLELWEVESVSGRLEWHLKGLGSTRHFRSETVARGTYDKALATKRN